MKWKHLSPEIEAAIRAATLPWKGCPYMPGQQKKGIGVDACTARRKLSRP